MTPAYVVKLGLVIQKTDNDVQKIDGLPLVIYEMLLVGFSVQNKLKKIQFFEETFMLADTNMEVILGMSFLIFSNANMQLVKKELIWRSYTITGVLSTTKRVELIDKSKFAAITINKNSQTYIVHVITLSATLMISANHSYQAQVVALLADETLVKVLSKYSNYASVF